MARHAGDRTEDRPGTSPSSTDRVNTGTCEKQREKS